MQEVSGLSRDRQVVPAIGKQDLDLNLVRQYNPRFRRLSCTEIKLRKDQLCELSWGNRQKVVAAYRSQAFWRKPRRTVGSLQKAS